jgi:hypothetical protein
LQTATRSATWSQPPLRRSSFHSTQAPEEDEDVTSTDTVFFKVLFCRTLLAEDRTPATHPWQSMSGQIRVQVSTMGWRSACQILYPKNGG